MTIKVETKQIVTTHYLVETFSRDLQFVCKFITFYDKGEGVVWKNIKYYYNIIYIWRVSEPDKNSTEISLFSDFSFDTISFAPFV